MRIGSLALGANGLLTMLFSPAITPLTKFFGYRIVYYLCHITGAVVFFLPLFPHFQTPIFSFILGAGMFTMNTIQNTVPYTLTGIAVAEKGIH